MAGGKRYFYDSSHFSIQTGKIGYLKGLDLIPTLPGDSFEINLSGLVRLSPLRRNLVMDAVLDLFAFFVPHRHAYNRKSTTGSRNPWLDMIEEGVDGPALTGETYTVPSSVGTSMNCLGFRIPAGTTLPLWVPYGYWSIHNRFFRHPLDYKDEIGDGDAVKTLVTNAFNSTNITGLESAFIDSAFRHRLEDGFRCCHLKHPLNTYMPATQVADRSVPSTANMDIVELSRVRARYKTELNRLYFGQRYNDLLEATWDVGANPDIDIRPELLMRKQQFLSGYDVDATDDAAIGRFSGKSVTTVNMTVPRRFIAEHGAIYIMALVRFPLVIYGERHPLTTMANPTYKRVAGDPDVLMSEPPEFLDFREYLDAFTSATYPQAFSVNHDEPATRGTLPFAHYFRRHGSLVDPKFAQLDGFPFLDASDLRISSGVDNDPYYIKRGVYDNIFQTQQLNDWQCQLKLSVASFRHVPPAASSIFAGTR